MKASIITVCRNAESTIEQTIKSVIAQTGVEVEYIVIDGGSTDGTNRIIEKYRNNIAVYVSEKDKGISDAFNKGIRSASGDLIGIINADDILLQGALKQVVSEMDDKTDVFLGHTGVFDEIEIIPEIHINQENKKIKLDKLKTEMVIPHPATFIRRSAYEKFGLYDVNYKNSMDRDLLLRMYVKGAQFQESLYVLTLFRSGGITTKNFKRSIEESYEISLKYGTGKMVALLTKIKKSGYMYLKMR